MKPVPDWRSVGEVVRSGGIVVYPTETSYALGCSAIHTNAVASLRRIKGREQTKALPVIVEDLKMLESFGAEITELHKKLAERFWPGPLTMLFYLTAHLPEGVQNSKGQIAARVSSHPWAQRIVQAAGVPIVATSCNPAGLPPALTVHQAQTYFAEESVAFYIDGGPAAGGASTIVEIVDANSVRILRVGVIPQSEIEQIAKVES